MEQILCENLSFRYSLGKEKVLDSISFSIRKGELAVICGNSGCGKTTLLRHIRAGLAPAGEKSGFIYIDGKKPKNFPKGRLLQKSVMSCRNRTAER